MTGNDIERVHTLPLLFEVESICSAGMADIFALFGCCSSLTLPLPPSPLTYLSTLRGRSSAKLPLGKLDVHPCSCFTQISLQNVWPLYRTTFRRVLPFYTQCEPTSWQKPHRLNHSAKGIVSVIIYKMPECLAQKCNAMQCIRLYLIMSFTYQ